MAARFPVTSIPGKGVGEGWQNSSIGSYVSRIGNLAGKKIGPNTLLKVMAGDELSATTIYYYQEAVVNNNVSSSVLTNLLVSLGQAISGSGVTSGLLKNTAPTITSQLNSSVPFAAFTDPDAVNTSINNPKAYLSILFFDERFNFISEGSASVQVSQAGDGAPALVLANIKAPKNGYAYVYVSNASDEMVYFDNLQVTNNHGQIMEEDHYYPFGLKIASISSRKMADPNDGSTGNKYLYNDKELIDDADLNWYDYGFRNYDPQIGRFPQLDPLTDEYPFLTPYQYASDDPIGNIDLDGLEGVVSTTAGTAKVLAPVTVIGKMPASVTSASKIVLNAGVRIGLDGVKTLTSQSIKRPTPVQDELNIRNTIIQHDHRVPYNERWVKGNGYKLLGNSKDGFYWGWNDAIYEDNAFWAMFLPMPKFLGGFGKLFGRAEKIAVEKNGFTLTRHGELTNGLYTVSKESMKKHVFGGEQGKSIFYPTLDAEDAVLKAAQHADEAGLWINNKAKVTVLNTNIGTLGNGQPTNIINVYRNSREHIHGAPGN